MIGLKIRQLHLPEKRRNDAGKTLVQQGIPCFSVCAHYTATRLSICGRRYALIEITGSLKCLLYFSLFPFRVQQLWRQYNLTLFQSGCNSICMHVCMCICTCIKYASKMFRGTIFCEINFSSLSGKDKSTLSGKRIYTTSKYQSVFTNRFCCIRNTLNFQNNVCICTTVNVHTKAFLILIFNPGTIEVV